MYENSRFLKNRFTFCGVNTNFGQQWAPPAYYHLTPIVSKGKHWISAETCGLDDVFPPDDLGSGPCTSFIIYIPHIIAAFLVIKINSF